MRVDDHIDHSDVATQNILRLDNFSQKKKVNIDENGLETNIIMRENFSYYAFYFLKLNYMVRKKIRWFGTLNRGPLHRKCCPPMLHSY